MKLSLNFQSYLAKIITVGICSFLTACDFPKQSADQIAANSTNLGELKQDAQQEGKRLTEVAGRTALPHAQSSESAAQEIVSTQSRPYVGRYHVIVDCREKFALCAQGKAEFMINLLKDGTSHRTLIYLGKMSYEKKSNQATRVYQQNTWRFNPQTRQIEIRRIEGVYFYYNVNKNGDLVIDLKNIYSNNEIENGRFIDGTYVPTQEYVLKKLISEEEN